MGASGWVEERREWGEVRGGVVCCGSGQPLTGAGRQRPLAYNSAPTHLVEALGHKVGGEAALKALLVLKGVVLLRVGHGACGGGREDRCTAQGDSQQHRKRSESQRFKPAASGLALTRLEPAVKHLLHAPQLALALARGDGEVVDEVAVQVGHLTGEQERGRSSAAQGEIVRVRGLVAASMWCSSWLWRMWKLFQPRTGNCSEQRSQAGKGLPRPKCDRRRGGCCGVAAI